MSAEQLNLSRERRRAFRAGKFPEDLITKDMIKEIVHQIECPPGTPNYKEFKVTEGMLLTNVPKNMSPPIEYCDHLVKINDVEITSKKIMQVTIYRLAKANKEHTLKFTVRRVICMEKIIEDRNIPPNASIRKKYDKNGKPNSGYYYYKIVLVYFPRSKLGINVKSYGNVVYVESTDNSWGSTTRRFLYLGDAILKIDDTEVSNLFHVQTALRNGLQQRGVVTMIVERACEQGANNYVRSVLNFQKNADPQIPQDAILTCKERLEYLNKNGFGPEPKSIYRGERKYDPDARISLEFKLGEKKPTPKNVIAKKIPAEHLNPTSMIDCPSYLKEPKKD
ncbi:unnamed protein product [Caenorhabditis sp. 36 PRJEB53466]|nr:unnamed protein product [Caenorhabditis sp. 36 PRJEB53466]